MSASLSKGDRVRLILKSAERKHARVKEWVDHGCINVTYADEGQLTPGDCVELERLACEPKSLYYMQVFSHEKEGQAGLTLRRNPAAAFNLQRRGLRIHYAATTSIRAKGALHFLSAQFINLSLTAAGVLSETPFAVDSKVEFRLVLPERPVHLVAGIVTRVSPGPLVQDVFGRDLFGLVIEFAQMNSDAIHDLTFFMWQQVRKAYSEQLRQIFETKQQGGDGTQQDTSGSKK